MILRASRHLNRTLCRSAIANSSTASKTLTPDRGGKEDEAINYAITPWQELLKNESYHDPRHSLGIQIVGTVLSPVSKSDKGYYFEVESKAPTDDDLAESGIPNSGHFKVFLLPMCVKAMEQQYNKIAMCIKIGNMINLTGTIRAIPCDKNEYSYTCVVYATHITRENDFGTIVQQRKEIVNIAHQRETQRRRDAVIKEREEQKVERERLEKMEADRAEQHAKRLKIERQRKVKAKMSKLGATSDQEGPEAMLQFEKKIKKKVEESEPVAEKKPNDNNRRNDESKGQNRRNDENRDNNMDRDARKAQILDRFEDEFHKFPSAEIQLQGKFDSADNQSRIEAFRKFKSAVIEKFPSNNYKNEGTFITFNNFNNSFLIRFNSPEHPLDFQADFGESVELENGVSATILRVNAQ